MSAADGCSQVWWCLAAGFGLAITGCTPEVSRTPTQIRGAEDIRIPVGPEAKKKAAESANNESSAARDFLNHRNVRALHRNPVSPGSEVPNLGCGGIRHHLKMNAEEVTSEEQGPVGIISRRGLKFHRV